MAKFLLVKVAQPSDNGIVYNMINLDNVASVEVYKETDVGTVVKLYVNVRDHYRLMVKESAEVVVGVLREDDPVLREAQTSNDAR